MSRYVNQLRSQLTQYYDSEKALLDAVTAMNHFTDLKPSLDSFILNGQPSRNLVTLTGTIPVKYDGNVYNIPIAIYLMEQHPHCAPYVFVKPTSSQEINIGPHVDSSGQIFLPYLGNWTFGYSYLLEMIHSMVEVFKIHSPVVSKPTKEKEKLQKTEKKKKKKWSILSSDKKNNDHRQALAPLTDDVGDVLTQNLNHMQINGSLTREQVLNQYLPPYPLSDSKPRGLCLIINNEEFTTPKLTYRSGSSVDSAALQEVFRKLNYKVIRKDNCTYNQMVDSLVDLRKGDKDSYDSVIICLMSHGGRRGVFSTDGEELDPLLIVDLTNTIKNKPKLVFIQACRGPETDYFEDAAIEPQPGREISIMPKHIDYLFAYATVDRHVSYRSGDGSGSYFMQRVCDNIRNFADYLNVVEILTTVVNDVSHEGIGGGYERPKFQVPEITSRLTKRFFFKKKKE